MKFICFSHSRFCKVKTKLIIGIHNVPSDKNYFSSNPLLNTPNFSKILSERRFILIVKFIHFNDNSKSNEFSGEDRLLFKINPVLKYLRERIKKAYIPESEVCIDESLLLWKGRLKYKVYMPLKSARFGIKYYQLCDSRTGYIWNFLVYIFKEIKFDEDIMSETFFFKVEVQFIKELLGKGYFIVIDNFFLPYLYLYS